MGRLVRRYIRAYNATVVNKLTVATNDVTNAIVGAAAGKKIVYVEASITGTGNITMTGLTTVQGAVVSVKNSGTTLPTNTASITGIAGNVVSVVVTQHATAANSVETAAKTVGCLAIGT
jgi:hypothetical protein